MNPHPLLWGGVIFCLALVLLAGCSDSEHGSPPPPDHDKIAALCQDASKWGDPAELPMRPASIGDLEAKNEYDLALRAFLREHVYRDLGWISDQEWRLTGPLVGDFPNPESYGVHPAVRIWYSPEVIDWLCDGRPEDGLRNGAMIVKEMHSIDEDLFAAPGAECLVVDPAMTIDPIFAGIVQSSLESADQSATS